MSIFFSVRQLDLIPSMVLRNPLHHPLVYFLASKEEEFTSECVPQTPCKGALPLCSRMCLIDLMLLRHREGGAFDGLADLDAHGEGLLQFLDMGDDDNLLEVILNSVDGLHQPLQAGGILGTEPLVYEQGWQWRSRAVGQEFG